MAQPTDDGLNTRATSVQKLAIRRNNRRFGECDLSSAELTMPRNCLLGFSRAYTWLMSSFVAVLLTACLVFTPAKAATIMVDSAADTSSPLECTLRDAINSINLSSLQGGCSISQGSFAERGLVDFALPTPFTITLENGPLMVTADMIIRSNAGGIEGAAEANIRSSDGALHRIFHISGAQVTILNFTVSNGVAEHLNFPVSQEIGGGIYATNGADVRVSNCIIVENRADIGGGLGADQDSVLSVAGSQVSGNSAVAGGGIGTIDSSSVYIFRESIIDDNHATELGGGVGVRTDALLSISRDSRITNNRAYADPEDYGGMGLVTPELTQGGGIYLSGNSRLELASGSVVSGNTALRGGGIYLFESNAEINGSVIEDNLTDGINTVFDDAITYTTGFGGGVYLDSGNMTLQDSEVRNNLASSGAGIVVGSNDDTAGLTVSRSTVASNVAQNWGGGIALFSGASAFITNATVSGNITGESPTGGVFPAGGGLYSQEASLIRILNSTFVENTALSGSGGGMHINNNAAILANNIIAGNDAFLGSDLRALGGSLSLTSNGNLYGDSSKTFDQAVDHPGPLVPANLDVLATSTIQNGDDNPASRVIEEIVLPLANNQGPGQGIARTHMLTANSPALDAGAFSACLTYAIEVDQRGAPRNDGRCDIGSVELEQTACYVIKAQNSNVVTFCL